MYVYNGLLVVAFYVLLPLWVSTFLDLSRGKQVLLTMYSGVLIALAMLGFWFFHGSVSLGMIFLLIALALPYYFYVIRIAMTFMKRARTTEH